MKTNPLWAILCSLVFALHCATNSGSDSSTSSTTSSSTTNTTTTTSTASTTSATISTTTATLDNTSGCITNVNTSIGTDLPGWATDNFKCQVAYTSGTNYIFKSANLPNHQSFYYCGSHAAGSTTCSTGQNATLWAALPGTNYAAGTNVIASQNLVYTIPATPTLKSGTLTSSQGCKSPSCRPFRSGRNLRHVS